MTKFFVLLVLLATIAIADETPSETDRVLDLLLRGSAYMDEDLHEKSIELFSTAIRLQPGNADAYVKRGEAYARIAENGADNDSYRKAISDFSEALQIAPKTEKAIFLRGICHTQLRNDVKALQDITESVRLNPKDPIAIYVRGKIRLRLNEQEKAIEDFSEAIRLQPQFADPYMKRAIFFYEKQKYDACISDCSKAIEFAPMRCSPELKLADVFYLRGGAYSLNKDYYKAMSDYLEACSRNPDDADYRATLDSLAKYVRDNLPPSRAQIVSIKLDPELKKVEIKKSPPIFVPSGSEKLVEDTVRVGHSVSIAREWKAEAELKGRAGVWWAEIEASLKGSIQKSTIQSDSVDLDRKRSVTLKGRQAEKGVRVVWVEYYRTGIAKMKIDDKEVLLPFEFKEDFDLLMEDANQSRNLAPQSPGKRTN